MTYPYQPTTPPQRSPLSSPPVIAALVVGVLILIGGTVGALLYADKSRSNDSATSTPPAGSTTIVTTPGQSQSTVTVTAPPPAPSQPVIAAPTPESNSSGQSVSGADRQGFSVAGARCNSDDSAVFIGRTNRSQIVVCQVGNQVGRNYYKGYADGDSIEIGYPTRNGSTFTAQNGATVYQVSPSALVITVPDSSPHRESMIESWVS